MREKNQKRTGRSRRDDGKNVRYGDRERRSERRRETKGFREKEEGRSRGGVNAGRFRRERVRKAYVREGVGMSGRDGMKSSAKRPLRRNFGEDASYREESYKTRINRRPYGERHRNDRSYESRPDRSDRTYTKEKFLKKLRVIHLIEEGEIMNITITEPDLLSIAGKEICLLRQAKERVL